MFKKAILIILILAVFSLSSCSSYIKDSRGETTEVSYYGFLNSEDKLENVIYKVSAGSIVCAIIFSETILAPILILGFALYEPVSYK